VGTARRAAKAAVRSRWARERRSKHRRDDHAAPRSQAAGERLVIGVHSLLRESRHSSRLGSERTD